MIKFPVSKPQTVQTHNRDEPYPSNFENVREPAHSSLAQKIENDDKILKIFILEPKCTCQMGANPNDPKLEQTSCTLQPNGPGWPYELLLHPLVPKRISVPEFYLSCGGPPCQCSSVEQINFICDDQNCDEQIKIEGKKILINPAVMTQKTTELLFIAQIPDGQQFMVQEMKLRLVDPMCPPELFEDFDGNLMAIDDLAHIINLPLGNPDKSQQSQCGQPTITTQDKCLVLQQSDDLLAVTYNTSACNHLGGHESQLQIYFDQFYNAVSTVNLKYQFQCVPKLELRGASLKEDFYFDELLSNTDQGMTIEVGLWQADKECSTPFNQRLQMPPGLMQWYSYDEIKQTVHIFGYPDDSSISQVVFELQALVENTVVKSSTTTINFSRNQVPQKRRLQTTTFPDNRQVSPTAPTLTYICTLVVGGTPCTNARVYSGTESNVYDNNGFTFWGLESNDVDTKWAITETYTTPVTVKTVISRMVYCSTSNPCRIYIGNSADYTQNTQCGADQTTSGYNMFTCNLQGKYVTTVLYTQLTTSTIVQLREFLNFANAIIPNSAMQTESTNCVTAGQLTKNIATSLGDLTGSDRYYEWNVPSGCSGANPYIKNKLYVPYVIQGVYLMKYKSPAAQSSPIEVLVDGVSCGTLTDKNQVTSMFPISRLKCNQPLTGTEITFRFTDTVLDEDWTILAIFGTDCNSGNSMIAPSIPARTVDQTQTTAYIDAFKDYASGTTNPPTCGARTCMSDHQNVPWDNNFQRFEVKSLGDADLPGNYTVMLRCFLKNYPTIPVASQSFVLTVAPKAVDFKCQSNKSLKTTIGNYGQLFFDQAQNNSNFTVISIQSFEAFVNKSQLFVRSQNSSDIGRQQLTIMQTNDASQCYFTVSVLFQNETSELVQSAQNLNETQDQNEGNLLNQTKYQSYVDEQNQGFLDYQQDWLAAYKETFKNKETFAAIPFQPLPDVFIQSIDQNGTVKLRFTQEMVVPKIANLNDSLQGNQSNERMLSQISAPALTFKVIPAKGQSQENLKFSYNITSYTERSMTIELNFFNALKISSQEQADWLQIEFTNSKYFFDRFGNFIVKNKVLQYRLPRQMTKGQTAKLIEETAEIIFTSTVVVITSFLALNILLSASLNMLMTMVDSQQLLLTMGLWNISMPPTTSFYFGYIQKIANFDILPTDDIWNYFFPKIPKGYQIDKKFQQLGFDSEYFLFNIGTFLFSFGAYPLIIVLCLMLKCYSNRDSRIKSVYEKANNSTFYNYPITLLTESFLSVGLCAMINMKNVSSYSNLLDSMEQPR